MVDTFKGRRYVSISGCKFGDTDWQKGPETEKMEARLHVIESCGDS